MHLLNPKSPLIVQHALLGLLRNLSIPEPNRKPLGEAGVVEGVVNLEPWSEQRDVVGAVQGSAIGVIKALVRDRKFVQLGGDETLADLQPQTQSDSRTPQAPRTSWPSSTAPLTPPSLWKQRAYS